MEEGDSRCFYGKQPDKGGPYNCTILDGVGKDGSRGIKVVSADREITGQNDKGEDVWSGEDWDCQFWIRLPQALPAGTKYKVKFDYMASKDGRGDTQAHVEAGDYIHWAAIGSANFTTNWQTYEAEGSISGDMSKDDKMMHSIAFNLSCNHEATEFYFDNISFEIPSDAVTDFDFPDFVPEPAEPVEITWTDILANADQNKTFYKTEQGVGGPWAVSPENGEIAVLSADNPTLDWDTQFFVRLPKKLAKGTKYKVSFKYKASQAADADTQAHFEPGAYQHWAFIGSPSFGTEWNTYTNDGAVTDEQDGVYTIAFNLAKNKMETTFYFSDFHFEVPEDAQLDDAPEIPDYLTQPVPTITIADEWATFVPSYSMDLSNSFIHAYSVAYDAEENKARLSKLDEIPYRQAVLLWGEDGAGTYDGISIKRVVGVETGLKAASTDASKPTKGDASTIYVFAEGTKGDGFYLLGADVVVPAGKGYLEIEIPEAAGREFIGLANDATTIKAVENLKENGIIYNLAGQQVKNAKKGLYIIDGKKVMK